MDARLSIALRRKKLPVACTLAVRKIADGNGLRHCLATIPTPKPSEVWAQNERRSRCSFDNIAIKRQPSAAGVRRDKMWARTASGESTKDSKQGTREKVDLGRCGSVTLHLSPDRKRLLIEFRVDPEGFDKTGLNGFIDALEDLRKRMKR